jgi:phosphoribosylaminoimidazolecarboxamide formyltransferase / IMP cyclohydrolase
MSPRKRAIVSVFDKTGVVDLCRALEERDWEIVSTGGTAAALKAAGVAVVDLSDVTGFPEMLEGRVKTLHPRIHAGILARPTADHLATLARHDITPVDLVVVNLYPFADTIARPGVTVAEAIEMIDIGGPTMLRAAAKNHERVAVVCDPADYPGVIAQVDAGGFTAATRWRYARKVFTHTAEYDATVRDWMAGVPEQEV